MKTQPSVVDLQQRLENSLLHWYPDLKPPFKCKFVRCHTFRWSVHQIFHVVQQGRVFRSILVKSPNGGYMASRRQDPDVHPVDNGTRMEYEALQSLYSHFGGREYKNITAVRPLSYYPDIKALVVEYFYGENLLNVLARAGQYIHFGETRRIACQTALDSGRLLAYVHQISMQSDSQNVDCQALMNLVEEKLGRLRVIDTSSFMVKKLDEINSVVSSRIAKLSKKAMRVKLHGDYYPENVVRLPDGNVFTIDTTMHQTGYIEQDMAKFVVGIETTKKQIIGGSWNMNQSIVTQARQFFLQGYQSIRAYDSDRLLVFQAVGMLQRWAEVLEVLNRSKIGSVRGLIHATRITPFMLSKIDILCRSMENGS